MVYDTFYQFLGTILTEGFLNELDWSKAAEYKKAKRMPWKVSDSDSEVAGYVRQVGDFYQVSVRSAGHMVPYDQPKVAMDLIDRFINNLI